MRVNLCGALIGIEFVIESFLCFAFTPNPKEYSSHVLENHKNQVHNTLCDLPDFSHERDRQEELLHRIRLPNFFISISISHVHGQIQCHSQTMQLNMLKTASLHAAFYQVARAELSPGSHNEWHRAGCRRSAGSLDSTVIMSHISKTKFFFGMLSTTLWCGLSDIIGLVLTCDTMVKHSTTSLSCSKVGAKHPYEQVCDVVCATNEQAANFDAYRPVDFEFVMNVWVKVLLMMCNFLVVNFLRLNFHFSIIAEPLMRYLRSKRTYRIGAARFVGRRRHRLHRRRVWRYETWRQKQMATNFTHYFLVTRSWVKTLRDEIRYLKENFSIWIKTTKYFHHDDLPFNVVAQGSLDVEYLKNTTRRPILRRAGPETLSTGMTIIFNSVLLATGL